MYNKINKKQKSNDFIKNPLNKSNINWFYIMLFFHFFINLSNFCEYLVKKNQEIKAQLRIIKNLINFSRIQATYLFELYFC
jgi:hypothetical protein